MTLPGLETRHVAAQDILAGVGLCGRTELCNLIALLESLDGLGIAKGAIENVGRRLRLVQTESANALKALSESLGTSQLSDEALRHRLWHELATALALPTTLPLSPAAAQRAAASLAVRTSERLSPSLRREQPIDAGPVAPTLQAKLDGFVQQAKV